MVTYKHCPDVDTQALSGCGHISTVRMWTHKQYPEVDIFAPRRRAYATMFVMATDATWPDLMYAGMRHYKMAMADPRPQTLDPRPQTLDPRTQTPDPRLETRDPRPQTLDPRL
eukprot:1817204-Rhodomonas_salina.1